jgi:hypothetical protein
LKVSFLKFGVLATIVALALVAGTFRPTGQTDRAEAALFQVLGWPSAIPGTLPAQAPADGPGASALVLVTCQPDITTGACPRIPTDPALIPGPVDFTLTQVVGDGSLAATFDVTGGATLKCSEETPCDLDQGPDNVSNSLDWDGNIAVQVNGGGENEVVNVQACDAEGDCRNIRIIFTETMQAISPQQAATGEDTTTLVSYACDVRSQNPAFAPVPGTWPEPLGTGLPDIAGDFDTDGIQDLEGTVDGLLPTMIVVGAVGPTTALNLPENYGVAWVCGNPGLTNSQQVTFETDKGNFAVTPFINPYTIAGGCPNGQSIVVRDYPFEVPGPGFPANIPLANAPAGEQCDLTGFDAVVSYGLSATGDVGVASLEAQQLGGLGPLRTANVTFTGIAALSLFIDAPASVGAAGAEFTTTIVDQDGRPVDGETIECTVSPTDSALAIIPQAGTSDSTGMVSFQMVPTGGAVVAGEELTITCVLDRNRDIRATATVNSSTTPDTEMVDLVMGCNFVSWTGADATDPADLAAAVDPQSDLAGLWAQQPPPNWAGYSPEFPEVSDMGPVDQLDVISICMTGVGTFERPVV